MWKFTKEKPLRVFTAFSGYDSQCIALRNIGVPYVLVGWSEIDKYAIQAHNAIFPEDRKKNYGDISKIQWGGYQTSTCLHTLSPAQIFQMLASSKVLRKALAHVRRCFGNVGRRLLPSIPSTS